MRCKSCDYPLWNLPGRSCPECGAGFKPSEYELQPNTVKFCCPGCGQAYYGTDERGHLVPPAFDCVNCGRAVEMDEMIVQPADGVSEADTMQRPFPWLDKKGRGRTARYWQTVGIGMGAPGEIERIGEPKPWRSVAFAAYVFATVGIVSVLPFLLIFGVSFVSAAGSGGGGGGAAVVSTLGFSLAFIVGVPLLCACGIALVALLQHGVLKLTGPTRYPLGGTVETAMYCASPNIVCAIPCFGVYFVPLTVLWSWVTQAIALRKRQGVATWRAVLVSSFPTLGVYGSVGGLIAWVTLGISLSSGPGISTVGGPFVVQGAAIDAALRSYAFTNNGAGPAHGLELIDYAVQPDDFLTASGRPPRQVSIAGTDFDTFASSRPSVRRSVVANASLPGDVIAHRVGDVVFTYHGIAIPSRASPGAAPPPGTPGTMVSGSDADGLWLYVIVCEQSVAIQSTVVTVSTPDATRIDFPETDLSTRLANQNTLRQQAGLAPLPDPRIVTQATPVTESAVNGAGYRP